MKRRQCCSTASEADKVIVWNDTRLQATSRQPSVLPAALPSLKKPATPWPTGGVGADSTQHPHAATAADILLVALANQRFTKTLRLTLEGTCIFSQQGYA
ncbi:hypothetical protein [Comamonas faecalis]|uniref:hypothetical protein n=1 Tax=Comamonas faecalis TaxID=1387849 RepID=UPI0031ED05C2